jgi:hypothetical protein
MAKHSDQRAGDYEAENTGGLLSGLLADEEHLDRRAMFRLGSWGAASVGAVIVAVFANQSGLKSRHDEIAALDLTRQSLQIQSVAKESQNETRRLASAIDTLNGDRDRLYSRLTSLEQGLESVTGAIAKQNVPPPALPPVAPAAAAAISQPVAQTAAPEPAPAVAPVATTTTAAPAIEKTAAEKTATEKAPTEKPRADVKKPAVPAAAPVAAAAPSSPPAATVAAAPPAPAPSNPPAATSAEPLMASKSLMSPPDAAAGKLIEPEPSAKTAAVTPPPATPTPAPAPMMTPAAAPEVAASAPAADTVAVAEPAASASPPVPVKRTEFGVDVGSANSVGGLRALWRGLLKWRSNAALATLQPIIVVKEGNNGLGMQLRLVAGPLTDAAAAAKICASMTANDRHCETTVFDGQRLALAGDEAPATTESISAKPSSEKTASETSDTKSGSTRQSSRRRGYSYAKRAPPEEPPKPPPPQPSSLSWFHLRSQ